ncbi:MAG: tripartite tricarboxylate transporter substrate-binding protein [Pseudomonadota bacterium]
MTQRRTLLRSALALPLASVYAPAFAADGYPSKPITIYVAFGPGGAGDAVTRRVAQKMSENIGQPVIIENRPGAGAAAAAVPVAKSRPDGYTVLLTGNGSAVSSVLFTHLPYDLKRDFRHVSSIASFDLAMIVDGKSPFTSVAEVLAYGKANPGKLSIGVSRIGSTQHLAAEMFKAMAHVDAVSVPYKTTGDMLAGLRGGDVQLSFEILSPILGQLSSKTIRALAVTSARRFPGLPDVPTLEESGVAGFEASSWAGISVPAKTPTSIVERLSLEIQKAVAAPDVQQAMQAMGYVAGASTPEQMTQRINQDMAKWKAVIDKAGVPRQ